MLKYIVTIFAALLVAESLQQTAAFQLVIRPDNFPEDLTWEIETQGQIIGRGTSNNAAGNIPVNRAYTFRIFDSFGDGICCGNGRGSYEMRTNGMNFFVSGGEFGSQEIVEFFVNGNGVAQRTNGPGAVPPPPPPAGGGAFDIVLRADPSFNPAGLERFVAAMERSAARWESVIVGDLPNINGIDDLEITYNFNPIDGPGGTLGSAGPRQLRAGSLLPYTGVMQFDSADINNLNDNQLDALFLHEMGHILGLGTLWRNLGCSQCEQGIFPYNPTGECPRAAQEFRGTPGRSPGAELLIENDGGQGTRCGHFDEQQLQSEVMTGFLTVNPATGISEISRITIGSLQDMGYIVNFGVADPFTVPIGPLNSEVIMDLNGDMEEGVEMTIDYPDDEQEWDDLMVGSGFPVAAIAGIVAGVALVSLAVVGVVIKRRGSATGVKDGTRHVALQESFF